MTSIVQLNHTRSEKTDAKSQAAWRRRCDFASVHDPFFKSVTIFLHRCALPPDVVEDVQLGRNLSDNSPDCRVDLSSAASPLRDWDWCTEFIGDQLA